MYSRPPMGRFPKGMRVPENYSGNAFGSSAGSEKDKEDIEVAQSTQDTEGQIHNGRTPTSDTDQALPVSHNEKERRPSFGFDLGRFFPSNRSFGMEEFLIIALILLLAQNDTEDDTLIFLILLLFIK